MSTYYDVQLGSVRLDPYRVMRSYEITDPAIQHALKKLLRCGRGSKSADQDIREAIKSLERYLEMEKEDEANRTSANSC